MRKQSIVAILFPLIIASSAWAQTATPASSPTVTVTPSEKSKQIEELKERLATKVAELAQTQRRAIFGTVKSVSISTATIETVTKDMKIELTDDIKIIQILKGKRTTLTTDAISKGDVVSVFGQYDTTLDILKAKVIFIEDQVPVHVSGTVTQVDKTAFTLTLQTTEGKSYLVDIEKFTKTTLWDGQNLTKAGFSKIQLGDNIHVVGSLVPKKENRISPDRILDLGSLSGAPRPSLTPTPTKESSPSPTTKPTATPMPTP